MADLSAVMDALSAAVATIPGLRAHPYWLERPSPPFAIVGWPDEYEFDQTMGRGSDRCTVPLTVGVGQADARSSRDRLAKYVAGSGADSVKAAVEAYETTAWMSAAVTRVEFGVVTAASVQYLSATFDIDIALRGEE